MNNNNNKREKKKKLLEVKKEQHEQIEQRAEYPPSPSQSTSSQPNHMIKKLSNHRNTAIVYAVMQRGTDRLTYRNPPLPVLCCAWYPLPLYLLLIHQHALSLTIPVTCSGMTQCFSRVTAALSLPGSRCAMTLLQVLGSVNKGTCVR